MHWLALVVASLFEAFIPLLIIRSENYTHLIYTSLLLLTVLCSITGLRYGMRKVPLSIAYAVWTSLGALGTAFVGVIILNETLSFIELICLMLIIVAVAGLRISSSISTEVSTSIR